MIRIVGSLECQNVLYNNYINMNIPNTDEFVRAVNGNVMGFAIGDNIIILRQIAGAIEITYMEAQGRSKVQLLNVAKGFGQDLVYTGVTNCIPNNSKEVGDGIWLVQ